MSLSALDRGRIENHRPGCRAVRGIVAVRSGEAAAVLHGTRGRIDDFEVVIQQEAVARARRRQRKRNVAPPIKRIVGERHWNLVARGPAGRCFVNEDEVRLHGMGRMDDKINVPVPVSINDGGPGRHLPRRKDAARHHSRAEGRLHQRKTAGRFRQTASDRVP